MANETKVRSRAQSLQQREVNVEKVYRSRFPHGELSSLLYKNAFFYIILIKMFTEEEATNMDFLRCADLQELNVQLVKQRHVAFILALARTTKRFHPRQDFLKPFLQIKSTKMKKFHQNRNACDSLF